MSTAPAPQSEIKKPRKSRRRVEVNGRIKVAHRRAQLMRELERNPAITMPELAELFKVSESTVVRDMVALATFYKRRAGDSREVWLGRMLQHYDAIYSKAEEGWRRSLEDRSVETDRAADGESGSYTERKKESQSGNPSFLAEQSKALAAQAKLLGLDAPTKATLNVVNADAQALLRGVAQLCARAMVRGGVSPAIMGEFQRDVTEFLEGGAAKGKALGLELEARGEDGEDGDGDEIEGEIEVDPEGESE